MGTKVRFTEGRLQRFACPAGKQYGIHLDAETPGLGVRVTENAARSYIFEARVHGKTVRVTIGDVRSWPLAKARAEARGLATLVDRGIDPRDEADQKRVEAGAAQAEERRNSLLFAAVWQTYIATNKGRWGERHRAAHRYFAQAGGEKKRHSDETTVPGPLAALMTLKLAELTPERIARWIESERKERPTSAASSFRLLRAFVNWTREVPEYKSIVPTDACTARAVRDVLPSPQTKEGDCLQREQLPAWFQAVQKLGNPVISAYLQGLLLTGARREEIGSLRWGDVDFQWNSLTIRDKMDGQRTIPLTPFVASLLCALPRRNEWVFSSPAAKDGRMVEPRIAHNSALEAAGLPHVSLHGLRRSFGTLAEWVEIPTGVVAQIQGHKPSALAEKHYRRRPLDLLRSWHGKLEAWVLEQAGIAFAAPNGGRLGVVNVDGSVTPAA
jgi:integrase